jgi:hypothetical protein
MPTRFIFLELYDANRACSGAVTANAAINFNASYGDSDDAGITYNISANVLFNPDRLRETEHIFLCHVTASGFPITRHNYLIHRILYEVGWIPVEKLCPGSIFCLTFRQ